MTEEDTKQYEYKIFIFLGDKKMEHIYQSREELNNAWQCMLQNNYLCDKHSPSLSFMKHDTAPVSFSERNQEVLSKPIDKLNLRVRTINCLKAEKVVTLLDLINKTEYELIRTPNLGRKCLNEIKEMLSNLGLQLKEMNNG